jgi:two-component system sensor histidine kinase VicK
MSIGLGMSIIKTIIEGHDGNIWLTSEGNIGTTIFIKFLSERFKVLTYQ